LTCPAQIILQIGNGGARAANEIAGEIGVAPLFQFKLMNRLVNAGNARVDL
jgi:hypothetical protein